MVASITTRGFGIGYTGYARAPAAICRGAEVGRGGRVVLTLVMRMVAVDAAGHGLGIAHLSEHCPIGMSHLTHNLSQIFFTPILGHENRKLISFLRPGFF